MATPTGTTQRPGTSSSERTKWRRLFAIVWAAFTIAALAVWGTLAFAGFQYPSPNGVQALPTILADDVSTPYTLAPNYGDCVVVAGVVPNPTTGNDIWAQTFTKTGAGLWNSGSPVPVVTASGDQSQAVVNTTETTGGTFIGWVASDPTAPTIELPYGQMRRTDGGPRWPTPVPFVSQSPWPTTESWDVYDLRSLSDGANGVLGLWRLGQSDSGGHSRYSLLAQRLDTGGGRLWGDGGLPIVQGPWSTSTSSSYIYGAQTVRSGQNLYVAWNQTTSGSTGESTLLWVSSWTLAGSKLWQKSATKTTSYPLNPSLAVDSSGNPIVLWNQEPRVTNGTSTIWCQKFNGTSGLRLWGDYGKKVCGASGNKYYPGVVTGSNGSGIAVWGDGRYGDTHTCIYYSRLANGKWSAAQPLAIGGRAGVNSDQKSHPQIVSDGSGGAYVTWRDHRDGSWTDYFNYTNSDVYAQHIGADGTIYFGTRGQGMPVATQPGNQDQQMPAIGSDGTLYVGYRNTESGTSLWINRVCDAGNPQIGTLAPTSFFANLSVQPTLTLSGSNFGNTPGRFYLGSSQVPMVTPSATGTESPTPIPSGVIVWSNDLITYQYPYGRAGLNQVGIYDVDGVPSNAANLNVRPQVTRLSKRRGRVGTIVKIRGCGFGAVRNAGMVHVGGKAARIISWSDTEIEIKIPHVSKGRRTVIVETDGATSNVKRFRVTR